MTIIRSKHKSKWNLSVRLSRLSNALVLTNKAHSIQEKLTDCVIYVLYLT